MANGKVVLDRRGIKEFLKSDEIMAAIMEVATELKSDIELADSSGARWVAEEHERPSRATAIIAPQGKDDEEATKAKWTEVESGDIAKMLRKKSTTLKKFKKGQN